MRKLLVPLVIALIAGLGAGTGFTYMQASKAFVADTSVAGTVVAATDSAPPAAGTAADSLAGTTKDSLMTPADSLRAVAAMRTPLANATSKLADAEPVDSAKSTATAAKAPAAAAAAPGDAVKPKPTATADVAQAVKNARNDALGTLLPEQRLAKIFSQMQSKDAARVLEQMDDRDIRKVLSLMGDRQAAAILTALTPIRAAAITRGVEKAPPGDIQ